MHELEYKYLSVMKRYKIFFYSNCKYRGNLRFLVRLFTNRSHFKTTYFIVTSRAGNSVSANATQSYRIYFAIMLENLKRRTSIN